MTPTRISDAPALRPAPRITERPPYHSPVPPGPIDLWLNGNEGLAPPATLLNGFQDSIPELVRRYPDVSELEALIAERAGVPRECVVATAGADDAIYRACLTMLDRERELILPVPTFEMIERYARLAGGEIVSIDWPSGRYPTDDAIAAVTPRTAMIAVVSPNNPTGAVASGEDLRRLVAAAPHALLLVDLAYVEFAEEDLTRAALEMPNALVTRTLSKAWGLAGLRVGYALGPPRIIRWLRSAGNPYSVASLSAALAIQRLRDGEVALRAYVTRIRAERAELYDVLCKIGAAPLPSQANFVLAGFADAAKFRDGLARRGVAVRAFPNHPQLGDRLRITCPGEPAAFTRLLNALRQVAAEIKECDR